MLVKCRKPFNLQEMVGCQVAVSREQDPGFHITVGENYLVIEVIVDFRINSMDYRIVDNGGCPAIYKSDWFETVSGSLDGFCIEKHTDDRGMTITHKLIADSNFSTNYASGFWEAYFEADDKDSIDILKNVIKDLSSKENISAPELCQY